MDKETYDSLSLTRWLDKSGKPIEDHPELPAEHETRQMLKRKTGMPMEMMLKSKIVWETLKAKSYDLREMETRKMTIGEDLRRRVERLADDKPVVRNNDKDKPEVTILKREEAAHGEDSMIGKQPEDKKCAKIGQEKFRGPSKTDHVSGEESDIQEGNRTTRTRLGVRGVVEIRGRQ